VHFDWQQSEPLHAALCLPAVVVPLALGTHYGYPGTGVLMAGGAMCVGFGSFQKPLIWRWGPMLAAAVGIAVSTSLGTIFRDHPVIFGAIVVLWAFLYGLANAMGDAASWVGQQCCVYLVVSAAAPASLDISHSMLVQGALRGSGILAGGLLQMFTVLVLWRWVPRSAATFTDPNFNSERLRPQQVWWEITQRTASFHFAVRMAVTALASVLVFQRANFNNAYWIMMTALLIPKPEFFNTSVRTILRLAGTLLGAVVCTFLIVLVHPAGETLSVLVAIFLFACYCVANVNYGVFAVCITGYIVFILAIVHAPTSATIAHRVEATLLGGAVALIVHGVFQAVDRIRGKVVRGG
jgi:hypothetical protein